MPSPDEADRAHRAELLENTMNKVLDQRARSGADTGELTIRGPFGITFGGKGRAVLAVITIAAVLVGLYFHDKRMEEADVRRALEHQHMYEAMRETTYVLTLTEEQRQRLNLVMPDSLRARTLGALQPRP